MQHLKFALPTTDREAVLSLWRIGAPVTLQTLLAATLAFVDTLMVGGVGPAALGGVGMVGRVYFVLAMVLAGLSGGTGVLVAQLSGAGRRRAMHGPVSLALALGVLLALPMTFISLLYAEPLAVLLSPDPEVAAAAAIFLRWSALFAPLTTITMTLAATLRGNGDTHTTLAAGLAALALNTALNFLFINGHFGLPAYGVAAAAAATTCARILEIAWLLRAMQKSLRPAPLHRLPRLLRQRDWNQVLGSSMPLMFKEVGWAGGILASSLFISRMGQLPLAAFNLVAPVENIMISIVVGASVATSILLGHALGRADFAGALHSARRLLRLVTGSAAIAGLLVALVVQLLRHAGWLAAGSTPVIDPALHDMALDTLTVICVAFGAKSHNTMVSIGILRAGNDGRWMMWTDLCSMWLVNVPLVAAAALLWHWPLPAVVGVVALEEIFKVAIFHRRVTGGRWLRRSI
jgi:putative MATE family efflux protein